MKIFDSLETEDGRIKRTGEHSYELWPRSAHICGAAGYGQPGDSCPACEERERLSRASREAGGER